MAGPLSPCDLSSCASSQLDDLKVPREQGPVFKAAVCIMYVMFHCGESHAKSVIVGGTIER